MKMDADIKIASEQAKYKRPCEHCGHTLSFYAFERDKKICSWCGYYNYKNDFIKFKELLLKKRREIEYEKN